VEACLPRGFLYLFQAGLRPCQQQIVSNGGVKQVGPLFDGADQAVKILLVIRSQFVAAEADTALLVLPEALQDFR